LIVIKRNVERNVANAAPLIPEIDIPMSSQSLGISI